jgi:hypothetical protein
MPLRKGSPVVVVFNAGAVERGLDGERGRVTRVSPDTGWIWITLDRDRHDPARAGIEHGPFIERELRHARAQRDLIDELA